MTYDLAIIGGGAAGCSAAVTARQRNLSALVLYSGDGALGKAKIVSNYPGLPDIPGPELLRRMREHAAGMGAEFRHGLVRRVMPVGEVFSILAGNDIYESRAVILAMGTARVKLLPGEEGLVGQGISYCATCDGMFYKGGTVTVVASGAEAVEEANYLATLASVLYCMEKPHDVSALSPDIRRIEEKPLGFHLEGERVKTETESGGFLADGVFILRPAVAMTQLIPEVRTENNAIVLDEKLMTSVPCVFGAGDIAGAPLQVSKAAGDGNTAALSAAGWLIRRGRPQPAKEAW